MFYFKSNVITLGSKEMYDLVAVWTSMDDGPYWVTLLKYGSHDMRHTGFRRLTVDNRTPGFWGVTILLALPSANLFPQKSSLPRILNHSIWMSETPLMSKTLQQYQKQSIISELHELTLKSIFGSLRATIFSWSLIYIFSPISYGSLTIIINSFG